jgi:ABC-2 type transport system permease protein
VEGVPIATRAFPYLLIPSVWASRNRAARRQRGDAARALAFGGIALAVGAAIFAVAFWLTWQLGDYAEFGDYLLRLGLSWLFLTFLSFLAFSGILTALSTFFLSEDLRLLLASPISARRLFHARFARTVVQASWMVVVFIFPVLSGVGLAHCAPWRFYPVSVLAVTPFVIIPVAVGTFVTLLLVNIFPARRARDVLMLLGLVFAGALVVLLRMIQPEQLLNVESLPDVTDFFTTVQSPITPLLPSHWAAETIFAALQGRFDLLHGAALWTTALGLTVVVAAASERWHFSGFSKAQEARKTRFAHLRGLEWLVKALPLRPVPRHLLIKDAKVFLRDVSQWSQLLLLLALVLVYLYNFRVLDLDRMPYMSGMVKNVYAFVNLAMAGLVTSTVCARFVFPAVSSEGAAFWIVRAAPLPMSAFLWSKFWTGFIPVVVLTEGLTITSNVLLGLDPLLGWICAAAVFFLTLALVALAIAFGARYPRFNAENASQIAGSYGGIAFMTAAVLLVIVIIAVVGWPSSVYLWHRAARLRISTGQRLLIAGLFAVTPILCCAISWMSMRMGVRALEALRESDGD